MRYVAISRQHNIIQCIHNIICLNIMYAYICNVLYRLFVKGAVMTCDDQIIRIYIIRVYNYIVRIIQAEIRVSTADKCRGIVLCIIIILVGNQVPTYYQRLSVSFHRIKYDSSIKYFAVLILCVYKIPPYYIIII